MFFKCIFIVCLVTYRNVASKSGGPNFVPDVWIGMVSWDKISVQWTSPPPELQNQVHYFKLRKFKNNLPEVRSYVPSNYDVDKFSYTFIELNRDTPYYFQVAACNIELRKCGDWSSMISARTFDGIPSVPTEFTVNCTFNTARNTENISTSWFEPATPNGKIKYYEVTIQGNGSSVDEEDVNNDFFYRWKFTANELDGTYPYTRSFSAFPRTTNYTVAVRAVTVSGKEGKLAWKQCIRRPKKSKATLRNNTESYVPFPEVLYELLAYAVGNIW